MMSALAAVRPGLAQTRRRSTRWRGRGRRRLLRLEVCEHACDGSLAGRRLLFLFAEPIPCWTRHSGMKCCLTGPALCLACSLRGDFPDLTGRASEPSSPPQTRLSRWLNGRDAHTVGAIFIFAGALTRGSFTNEFVYVQL